MNEHEQTSEEQPREEPKDAQRESILSKIQKLLAKAEGTEFGPEAESFYAKAQELMLAYAIEEEELKKLRKPEERAAAVVETFTYSETGRARMPKLNLVNAIALENRCKVVMPGVKNDGPQMIWIAGFPDDISFVKLLYQSLSIVSLKEAKRQYAEKGRPGQFSNFIRNFYDGFTLAIRKRLHDQNEEVIAKAGDRALVLYDRARDVESALYQRFPTLRKSRGGGRGKAYNHDARGAGYASGMTANLHVRTQVQGGRKLIGGGN